MRTSSIIHQFLIIRGTRWASPPLNSTGHNSTTKQDWKRCLWILSSYNVRSVIMCPLNGIETNKQLRLPVPSALVERWDDSCLMSKSTNPHTYDFTGRPLPIYSPSARFNNSSKCLFEKEMEVDRSVWRMLATAVFTIPFMIVYNTRFPIGLVLGKKGLTN